MMSATGALVNNIDSKDLVLPVRESLDDGCGCDILTVRRKIYGVLMVGSQLQQGIDVRLQLHIQMVAVHADALHEKGNVPLVQSGLSKNVVKYIDDGFGSPVDLQHIVPQGVPGINLLFQTGNSLGQLVFDFRVGFLNDSSGFRGFAHGIQQLALQGILELLLRLRQLNLNGINGLSDLLLPLRLLPDGGFQLLQHGGGLSYLLCGQLDFACCLPDII